MMSKKRFNHWAIVLLGGGLVASCTNILGIDTSYDPNPCTDLSIDPQECGQGACHVFLDKDERCLNGLPTDCVEGTSNDQEVCKDGIDNNCDGNVDEGCACEAGATQECYNGSTDESKFGLCMKRGTQICTAGAWSQCDSKVLPSTEECGDGRDNDCDGKVDEKCPCTPGEPSTSCYGGPEGTEGIGVCRSGTQKCQADGTWGDCDGDVVPGTESWNGADDDCDGKTDDGYLCAKGTKQSCYDGPGGVDSEEISPMGGVTPECKAGEQECIEGNWGPCIGQVKPKDEFCDGKDNDCNHVVDDGSFQVAELCNNKDDNCNGLVDEGSPGGGEVCNTGKPGPCKDGVTACVNGGVECQQNVQATTELCNGVDDDCNGAIDDGDPEGQTPCNASDAVGACANGKTKCQTGKLTCVPAAPSTELCNGIDDNCDSIIDNGNPGSGQSCTVPGQLGVCAGGVTDCKNGGIVCAQVVTPTTEICDSKDNNCNGATDDNVPGTGAPCTVAGLQGECAKGATACQNGVVICAQVKQPIAELCDGFDNDCNGSVDEGDPGGGATCNVQGQAGVCGVGVIKCTSGALSCAQTKFPSPELCDGQDNDCDTQVDEGNPGGNVPCDTGKPGICSAGVFECISGSAICKQTVLPQPETCDGIDNDCDAQVDEGNPGGGAGCTVPGLNGECAKGVLACQNGVLSCTQTIQAIPEICDGKDNNCNGSVDDGNPGSGTSCNTGNVGVCAAGTTTCTGGSTVCNANNQPTTELCDGLDNDCDGQTDESNPGGGQFCTVAGQQGVCVAGTTSCQAGQILCNQNVQPSAEICDGKDNNCNGSVDEGSPGSGMACPVSGQLGECAKGSTICSGGGVVCQQTVTSTAETCDGKDNDCDGQLDEGNPGGGAACSTGQQGICSAGTTSCTNGSIACVQNLQPASETCDGLDNNCNGTSDEGNPGGGTACNTGKQGVCTAGTTACSNGAPVCNQNVQPSTEVCDGKDNDCNGVVDDGNPGGGVACTTGQPGVCAPGTSACTNGSVVCNQNVQPTAESCDGKDNDCDNQIDEGNPGGGIACSTGMQGVCAAGTTTCSSGATVCTQTTASSAEICDGLDNDCDGQIDEDNPGGGVVCTTGMQGVCSAGTRACSNGALVCTQNVQASAETCDGKDNDCNGTVDNGNPGGGAACPTGQPGVCAAGTTACTGGTVLCNQNVQASAELCDGLDNDCDNQIDENNPGGGAACPTGQPGVCGAGTTSCSSGAIVCNQNVQASTETCDGKDNDCDNQIDENNPGGGVACPTGQQGVCAAGTTACTSGATVCNAITPSSAEVCDGLDNDCDGTADEGNPGGGMACPTGQQGVCAAGTTACTSGATVCNVNTPSSAEVCDGLDNDCDGTADEGNPGGGMACSTGQLGVCAAGTTACTSGATVCTQNVASSAETPCDGLDNDCNGIADDGPFCCPSDIIKNGDESDINCGGSCTAKCADAGIECTTNAQCGTSTCGAGNKCVAQTCGDGDDCVSGVCTSGICQAPTCGDNKKNGIEGDIDCGGICPMKCASTKTCTNGADCESDACVGGVCVAAACDDGTLNGSETDVDCGGSCTTDCNNGKACAVAADCTSNTCDRGLCVPAACKDGMQNNNETAIDCGGTDCQVCPAVLALVTSGTTSPYAIQRAFYNGSWSIGAFASTTVVGTPSLAITNTRHAIGVIRNGTDDLVFTRWNGLNPAAAWAPFVALPSSPKANGSPVISAFGPLAEVAFRFQGPGLGKYHTVRHVGTPSTSTWLTPFQMTGTPTNATTHDLDWLLRSAMGNATLVFPEQGTSDIFAQLRTTGSWATAATTGDVTATNTIQPNIIRLSGGDLLMTFVNSANQIAFSRYTGGTWSAPAIVRNGSSNDKTTSNLRPALAPLTNNGAVLVYRNTTDSSRLYSVIYDGTAGWNTAAAKIAANNYTVTSPPVVVPGIGAQDAELLFNESGTLKHSRMSGSTWGTPAAVAGISANVQAIGAASFR